MSYPFCVRVLVFWNLSCPRVPLYRVPVSVSVLLRLDLPLDYQRYSFQLTWLFSRQATQKGLNVNSEFSLSGQFGLKGISLPSMKRPAFNEEVLPSMRDGGFLCLFFLFSFFPVFLQLLKLLPIYYKDVHLVSPFFFSLVDLPSFALPPTQKKKKRKVEDVWNHYEVGVWNTYLSK